jgi:tetratricopeptide (TPR) repeat protein
MGSLAIILLCLAGASGETATIESARTLVRSGRVVEALRQIRELEKQKPNDPNLQFELGEILQELAGSRAERLQKVSPQSSQVHQLIGKLLESHQKMAEALAEYEQAARANPSLPGIHFLIGNIYWKQRDFEAARPALETELKLNPNHALANLRMGQILLVTDANAPQTAIPYLRNAIADSHTGLEAHRELGKALRLSGKYQEAFHELELVARQEPDDELVHAQLAALYRAQGNGERVRKELEIQRQILERKRQASLNARQAEPDH